MGVIVMSGGNNRMDKRCPLKLEEFPDKFCTLAVLRLKALRNAGRELTEEEEALLPGCKYAVNNQTANYCMFKLTTQLPERPLTDVEIAHMCVVSTDTVKKVEKEALLKIRSSKQVEEVSAAYDGGILEEV